MGTVGHRLLLPLLALFLVSSAFSLPAPDLIRANGTPSVLLATAALIEPLSPPVTQLSASPFMLSSRAGCGSGDSNLKRRI